MLKTRTHRPTLRWLPVESPVESADSIPESSVSTTNFKIVGRLSISNMFNILNPLESANGRRPSVGVSQWEIGLVGTGLYRLTETLDKRVYNTGNYHGIYSGK